MRTERDVEMAFFCGAIFALVALKVVYMIFGDGTCG